MQDPRATTFPGNAPTSLSPVTSTPGYDDAFASAMGYAGSDYYAAANSPLGKLTGNDAAAQSMLELYNSYMANAFNSSEAEKDRKWQEYMSSTAYQRAAADLAALGFSPMALIGSGGSAAYSGSGSTARSAAKANAAGSSGSSVLGGLIKAIASIALMSTSKLATDVPDGYVDFGKGKLVHIPEVGTYIDTKNPIGEKGLKALGLPMAKKSKNSLPF